MDSAPLLSIGSLVRYGAQISEVPSAVRLGSRRPRDLDKTRKHPDDVVAANAGHLDRLSIKKQGRQRSSSHRGTEDLDSIGGGTANHYRFDLSCPHKRAH